MNYRAFRRAVLEAAGWQCENPSCDASQSLSVHHFLKQSTFPQYSKDPDNGMCVCGTCHSEIERRQREGEDYVELYPIGRYRNMLAKAGIDVPEGLDTPRLAGRDRALEQRAQERKYGQMFMEDIL